MTGTKLEPKIHPTEVELSDFLDNSLAGKAKEKVEEHIAGCDECLARIVSAYESVELLKKTGLSKKRKVDFMKKVNLYLILAVIAFSLSFMIRGYFIQLLVATLLLGIKWIVDSKSTKMLIMIYEAWKKGGEKEASRILGTLDPKSKDRF